MIGPDEHVPTREQGTEAVARIEAAVAGVVRGKTEQIRLAVACLVAEGHLLIEDKPGTGKTSLAKTIAAAIGGSVRRNEFAYRQGPVFANIVIADEINRASPKTQAALLEVMEERQVTNDGVTYPLPHPFMVVATQNPLDFHGTYPLPETQLDRFTVKLALGYAPREAELEVMARPDVHQQIEQVQPAIGLGQFARLIEAARAVSVSDPIRHYVADIVEASRSHRDLRLGVSTRGTLQLLGVARAVALANGRGFVAPDDVRVVALPVLAHRIALTIEAEIDGITSAAVVEQIIDEVPAPRSRTLNTKSA
jgi:MoxR-like ATPase